MLLEVAERYHKVARILVMGLFNTANKKLRCFDKHTFIHLWEFRTGAWTNLSPAIDPFMLAYVKWKSKEVCSL